MYMALAGAAMGALSGSQGSSSTQNQSSTSTVSLRNSKDLDKGRSALEAAANTGTLNQYNALTNMINQGPGQADVNAANMYDRDLAFQMNQFMREGPNQNQIDQANQTTNRLFAGQEAAMKFNFQDQEVQNNRLAARLGRSGNDPMLRAKLAQEQTRQQYMLGADKTTFTGQQLQQLPGQMMQMGSYISNIKNGLASQAFANRQNLLQLGNSLTQAERDYRINTATRTTDSTMSQSTPGGLSGAIGGALAGAGMGAGIGSMFGGQKPGGDTGPTGGGGMISRLFRMP